MINVYNDDHDNIDKAGDTGPSQCEEDEKKILGLGPLGDRDGKHPCLPLGEGAK